VIILTVEIVKSQNCPGSVTVKSCLEIEFRIALRDSKESLKDLVGLQTSQEFHIAFFSGNHTRREEYSLG
jgi:hypothetical protein